METKFTYYLGLDMGTDSLGWAVTDSSYHILRAKGKDLWGVRLFPAAETSVERIGSTDVADSAKWQELAL